MKTRFGVIATLTAATLAAQLTPAQKDADFRYLAGIYAKRYSSVEWKQKLSGFDALVLGPWLNRVARSKDDLEFYEICAQYVAALEDTHVSFSVPSDFFASLGFTVDLYDGKPLIDSINRARLPAARFPFDIGDEVVSMDGMPAEELIRQLLPYAAQSHERAARRIAVGRFPSRGQNRIPRAVELGEASDVVIRGQNGSESSYRIPWLKTGTPMEVGRVPSPKAGSVPTQAAQEAEEPAHERIHNEMARSAVMDPTGVLNYGGRAPVFALPAGFQQRQGRSTTDFFFSGTYQAQGKRIGFIRIPSYASQATAVLREFETEVAFFEQNTDGLVVDQMRNPGGLLCAGENFVERLTPYPFEPIKYELRATWPLVVGRYNALVQARAAEADHWVVTLYEQIYREVAKAYEQSRGLSAAVPICQPLPVRGPAPEVTAYTKPIVLLVDEFSTSTGDSVPAMLQDSGRALIFGMRTNGAGGTNTNVAAGPYSEGIAGVTQGLMVRPKIVSVPGYPTTRYIESVGVHPDIEYDYMTRLNLLQRGQPYVEAFTAALVERINSQR